MRLFRVRVNERQSIFLDSFYLNQNLLFGVSFEVWCWCILDRRLLARLNLCLLPVRAYLLLKVWQISLTAIVDWSTIRRLLSGIPKVCIFLDGVSCMVSKMLELFCRYVLNIWDERICSTLWKFCTIGFRNQIEHLSFWAKILTAGILILLKVLKTKLLYFDQRQKI